MRATIKTYGEYKGERVQAVTLTNKQGASVTAINYGCRLVSLKMPDKNGVMDEVLLGYDTFTGYENDVTSQGALVGRYGNRIAHAQFMLDGQMHSLTANNGRNHLHGGNIRYSSRIWEIVSVTDSSIQFHLTSPDGEEGYPGTLQVDVFYTLTDNNAFQIRYTAQTDRKTIVNLTNHSFFNLSSCDAGDVLNHVLQVESDAITEINEELIPTGKLLKTAGTAFDFTTPKRVGRDIDSDDEQMQFAGGYDHNFVLRGEGLRRVATLSAPDTGRYMDVITDQCGMQIYSANNLTHKDSPLRKGRPQTRRAAICLETQHFPDSPNHPEFPSTVLNPNEIYDTTTIFRFYAK